jgi:hypothetical protein
LLVAESQLKPVTQSRLALQVLLYPSRHVPLPPVPLSHVSPVAHGSVGDTHGPP